jgi:hypothetical protein
VSQTGPIAGYYIEYEVEPSSGYFLNVSQISIPLGSSTNNLKANFYYYIGSDNSGFTTSTGTLLNSSVITTSGSTTATTYSYSSLGLVVPSGSKLYVRVYPWFSASSSNTGKYLYSINTAITATSAANSAPTVTTTAVSSILYNSATTGGNVTSGGGLTVTERGVVFSSVNNPPTTSDTKVTDASTGTGSFISSLTPLTASTTYYVCAYAINSMGTSYGSTLSFATPAALPALATSVSTLTNFGESYANGVSAQQTFTVSGVLLDGSTVTVTAPAGFQVSTTSGTGFGSSVTLPYSSGTLSATTIYARFAPTSIASYSDNITVSGGGATTQNVAVAGSGVQYLTGDLISAATGTWATVATWNKWTGSAWTTGTVPTATDNVWINGGYTVTLGAVGTCKNLHVISGTLYSAQPCSTASTYMLTVAGTTIEVGSSGIIGNGLADNSADAISLTLTNTGTVTITGGGVIDVSKFAISGAGSTLIIDNNVGVHYHGSSNGGNASGFYPTVNNVTVTINAGKTLTMARYSCIFSGTSSATLQAFNFTLNVNGTLTLTPGSPTDASDRTVLKSYLAMNASTGYVFALNIGSTGTANITELYPNGSGGTVGTVSTITVASGGILNVTSVADFSKVATQTVTGAGTVSIPSGANLKIASTSGISASSALGPIQTTTRTFDAGATYTYAGTAAQVIGDGLPTTISNLIINNPAGVTLSQATTVNGTLTLTSGALITTSTNLLTLGTSATSSGASSSSYINGPLAITSAANTSAQPLTFPIGAGTAYRPAVVTVTQTTATATPFTATVINGSVPSNGLAITNDKVSTVAYATVSGSNVASATVQLSYVAADNVSDITNLRIAQGLAAGGGTWVDIGGTGSAAPAGTITSIAITDLTTNTAFVLADNTGGTNALPVELTSFTATGTRNGAVLVWKTATEKNNFGFNIERRVVGNSTWSKVGFVAGHGTSNSANSYSYADANVAAGTYAYRVAQVDNDGTVKTYNESEVTVGAAAKELSLGNYPNPFNPTTTFEFSVPNDGLTTVKIYNVLGQELVTAFSGEVKAGQYNHATFDGSKFSSGVYFYSIENNGQHMIKKMLMLK